MTYKLNRDYKNFNKGEMIAPESAYISNRHYIHPAEFNLLLDAGYLTPILDLPDDVKADIKTMIDFVERWNKQDNELYPAESAARLRTLIGE